MVVTLSPTLVALTVVAPNVVGAGVDEGAGVDVGAGVG